MSLSLDLHSSFKSLKWQTLSRQSLVSWCEKSEKHKHKRCLLLCNYKMSISPADQHWNAALWELNIYRINTWFTEYLNCWNMDHFIVPIMTNKRMFLDPILQLPPPTNLKSWKGVIRTGVRDFLSLLCQRQQEPTCTNSKCVHWIAAAFPEEHRREIPETNIPSDGCFGRISVVTVHFFFLYISWPENEKS